MTFELLVSAVCDANESHLEDPFETELVEVRSIIIGRMFNPKTMRWEEVHAKTYTLHTSLRDAKKLLTKTH